MATLDSSSTLAEIEAAYLDNVSYEEDASAPKARAFVTACKMLLLLRPSQLAAGGNVQFGDQAQLRAELERAQQYVDANLSAGYVRRLDFSNVRA